MTLQLPFDAQVNPVFPIHTWVADLSHLEPDRGALIADILDLVGTGPDDPQSAVTQPILQDRTERHWTNAMAAAAAFCNALASDLRPNWRHRELFAWASVRTTGRVSGSPVDGNTAYGAATFSCIIWLLLPSTEAGGSLAVRDPLYHLQERYGRPGYVAVIPGELKMFVLPGFLERFYRNSDGDGAWERPAIAVQVDLCYY